MKKLLVIPAILLISACTTIATPAPQSYRAAGENDAVSITGNAERKDYVLVYKTAVKIMFDNHVQTTGELARDYTGELVGEPYKNKPTSASCSSKFNYTGTVEIRCAVFIGNERAATLTF